MYDFAVATSIKLDIATYRYYVPSINPQLLMKTPLAGSIVILLVGV